MSPAFALALSSLLLAGSAQASQEACQKAAHDHTSFKAILSDDPSNRPQYETVERKGDRVLITRYVGDQKRVVRDTVAGLFAKENVIYAGDGPSTTMGFSHSTDLTKLLPLQPDTSVAYRMVMARQGVWQPVVSDSRLTVGARRTLYVGDCALPGIDLTIESTQAGTSTRVRTKVGYSPDLAYPVETTIEMQNNAGTKSFVTKLRDIEAWTGGTPQVPSTAPK